jgi:hypothetical protein
MQEKQRNKMVVLTETSEFMMSYVIYTLSGDCIIVDGGRPEDIPLLRERVRGRRIRAWFLTHAHFDHVSAFLYLVKHADPDFVFDRVYCNFPSPAYAAKTDDDDGESLCDYYDLLPTFREKLTVVKTGDVITVDEMNLEILYHFDESYDFVHKTINDTSIAFRLLTPTSSVTFLGDLGPEAGDVLVRENPDRLRAQYCQMAHHGHGCVGPEVYMRVNPEVCIWNAPKWLWEEGDEEQDYRCYGVARTRYWMERLGVKEHVVTGFGTAEILI